MKAIDMRTGEPLCVVCPNCGCEDVSEQGWELTAGFVVTLCHCNRCTKNFVPTKGPCHDCPNR
jgi:hypothetical protein